MVSPTPQAADPVSSSLDAPKIASPPPQPARDHTQSVTLRGTQTPPNVLPSLAASAKLLRELGGTSEVLLPDARIRPGDLLSLSVECSQDMYLYVLNEDETGAIHVLFPLPGLDTQNPLSAGNSHRVPGPSGSRFIHWKVSEPGGAETVLAIGSPEPLRALENDIAALPHASYPAPVALTRVSREAVVSLRSIGELGDTDAASTPNDQKSLSAALARATQSSAAKRLWLWQIRLQNPRP